MHDDLGSEDLDHTLKEPMPGTSRSLMDIDSHQLVDDGFGGTGFGRKFLQRNALIVIDQM